MSSKALIIFIKNPEPGKVKTRIAKTVGDAKAIEIYNELLEHTREVAINVDCDRHLFYFPMILEDDEWSTHKFTKHLQAKGDLGQKMETAFHTLLSKYESVVIIGSDSLEITPSDINMAFYQLEEHDVVLGPARDGGYYLLGMNDLQLFLFRDMPWSEDNLLEETIIKIQDRGLNYALLRTRGDIDFIEDYLEAKGQE